MSGLGKEIASILFIVPSSGVYGRNLLNVGRKSTIYGYFSAFRFCGGYMNSPVLLVLDCKLK